MSVAAADRLADFERLVDITRSLRAQLEGGGWGEAAGLEAERRLVIERIFDEQPTPAELPTLTAALREVVRLNDELIGLAEHRRRALARDLDTVTLGREASRAYRSVSAAYPDPVP